MNGADGDSGFLAEIDQEALTELDRRLAVARMAPDKNRHRAPRVAAYAAPLIDPEKVSRPLDFSDLSHPARGRPDYPLPAGDEGGAIDLLAELEREVAIRQARLSPHDRHDKAVQLHEALSRLFVFLNRISLHANQLTPEISRAYRLDARTAYTGLRWHEAFTDCRKQDLSENGFLSHVSFRVRLVAAQPVTLVRRWDQMEILKKDLHILHLRTLDEPVFTRRAEQEFVRLRLAPDFPVQMSFQGNYGAQRIDVLSRNLEGFCVSAFVLDSDHVGQSVLEGLGRFLLARRESLPAELRRINYVQPGAGA